MHRPQQVGGFFMTYAVSLGEDFGLIEPEKLPRFTDL